MFTIPHRFLRSFVGQYSAENLAPANIFLSPRSCFRTSASRDEIVFKIFWSCSLRRSRKRAEARALRMRFSLTTLDAD